MIHIIQGEEAAKNLEAAFLLDENLRGEVVILHDNLSTGPLIPAEGQTHKQLRSAYWQQLFRQEDFQCEDEHTIKLLIARAQREEEPVCFWMAPNAQDVCTYFWLLPYFKAYPDMLHTINIIGLPFLNEKGQLFYPTHFSGIPPKEFVKTKRLLKEVTPAEYETDGDEWQRLQADEKLIRTYEGGKKIISRELTYFDAGIHSFISAEFQKASKLIQESVKKNHHFPPAAFIEWRIRELLADGKIAFQGDLSKTAKDFEVKKVGEPAPVQEVEIV